MDNLMSFLEHKLAPFGEKVGKQRHLKAVREGIMMGMPLVMVGSFFLLITSFPYEAWNNWLEATGIAGILTVAVRNTFGLVGLLASFGVAFRLAESYDVDGPSAGVLSLSAFLISTPALEAEAGLGIPYGFLSGRGLFAAIFVGLISAEIYRWFIVNDVIIKMPDSVPEVVARSFSAILPGATIVTLFTLLFTVLGNLGVGTIHDVLAFVVGKPLSLIGGSLIGTFVAVLLNSIFWFAGVNGGQVVGGVMSPVWLMFTDENRIALEQGAKVLPNIITGPFIDLFVYMGGGGATIGLAILLLFFSKSKQYKTLGKVSGIPALFNINTAILFSFPTVLNPIMMIPFILAPITNAVITYFTMKVGIVARTTGVVLPWTTPPVIGGFLATGGKMSGAILHVVLIFVSMLIYYPFFRAADNKRYEAELKELEEQKA